MWLISCKTHRSRDYCRQTRHVPLPPSGRSMRKPLPVTPPGNKHSNPLSSGSRNHHGRRVTNQMMTGPGHNRQPLMLVSKQPRLPFSHQQSLSLQRVDLPMVHPGPGQHLWLIGLPLGPRIARGVSNQRRRHGHAQDLPLQESQVMRWHPSGPKMCLGRWGIPQTCPALVVTPWSFIDSPCVMFLQQLLLLCTKTSMHDRDVCMLHSSL